MKKVIATMAMVAMVGFLGVQQVSAQRGWGGGSGPGDCWRAAGTQNEQVVSEETGQAYNAFMDATVELRKEMFVKQEQMRALRFADNPDAEKIGALAGEIYDLRTTIRAKAEETGWQGGSSGPRFGCNGPGYGRGMGHGGMMGYGGHGPGYGSGCNGPKW